MGTTLWVVYPLLMLSSPNVAAATVASESCPDLASAIREAGVELVRCRTVALTEPHADGCECKVRGRQCPFDCSAEKGTGCVDAPDTLGLGRLTTGQPFASAAIGGDLVACMYWNAAAGGAGGEGKVQGLVRSAAEAALQNAAAGAEATPPPGTVTAVLADVGRAAHPAGPEDHFRTRCLTFSHGVVVQSGGARDEAYRLLQEHCLERKSGLEVDAVPKVAEERCRRYADAWLTSKDWTSSAVREAWCANLYSSVERPALLARPRW